VLAKFGFDPRTMPMKPMSVEQCVSEGLNALRENRSRIGPDEPHHERVGARFRETGDDSQDGRQNACEQACKRESPGLITDG
jgi:hypothetical protein